MASWISTSAGGTCRPCPRAVLRSLCRVILGLGLSSCVTVATVGAAPPTASGPLPAADAVELARLIDGFLATTPGPHGGRNGRAVIVPQVTDGLTGSVAGQACALLPADLDRIVLLAALPAAAAGAAGATVAGQTFVPLWESLRTALGEVRVDAPALQQCQSLPGLAVGDRVGPAEQAMVSILPFLQRRLPRAFRIVPLAVATDADPALLAKVVKAWLQDERTALVAVATGSLGPAEIEALFAPADEPQAGSTPMLPAHLVALHGLAADLGWKAVIAGHRVTEAGQHATAVLLADDPNRVDLLAQATKASWDDPLTQAAFADASRAAGRTNFQGDLLSQPEQHLLLVLARQTIDSKLRGETLPGTPLYSDTLAAPAACFVTLNQAGKLRGCIGTILPKEPLAAAVQRHALSAALEDKRFAPLTLAELPGVEIEISVLTPPRQLEFADGPDLLSKLQPGVHGVLLTYEKSKRTTFLPQVWGQFPDRATFMQALCRKAGIPLDGWQDPALSTVEVYESFDFAEKTR